MRKKALKNDYTLYYWPKIKISGVNYIYTDMINNQNMKLFFFGMKSPFFNMFAMQFNWQRIINHFTIGSIVLDHWNSSSKFREGPLLLSGNRVYSPATAPSITTRSIWIVTFPNEFCHQIKRERVKMQFIWKSRLIGGNTVSIIIMRYAFSFHLPSPFCSCSCKKYEASGPLVDSQRTMKSSHPTRDLDQLQPPDKLTLMRSYSANNLIREGWVTCGIT